MDQEKFETEVAEQRDRIIKRPKGKKRPSQRGKSTPKTDAAAAELRRRQANGENIGSFRKLAKETGIASHVTFDQGNAQNKGRNDLMAELLAVELPKSLQSKFDAHMRVRVKQMEYQIQERIAAEHRQRWNEVVMPHYNRQQEDARRVIAARKGAFTKEQFNLLVSCTHADMRASLSESRMNEAFRLLQAKKLVLVAEPENPVLSSAPPLPKNWEEWQAMHETVQRQKAAAKAANGARASETKA